MKRSIVFHGTRRSDRWVAYLFIALMVLMGLFVVYTSVQQHTADQARQDIIERLETQNRELLCFADNTQTYQLAATDYLIAQQRAMINAQPSPEAEQLLRDFEAIKHRLTESQRLCFRHVEPGPRTPGPR